MKKQYQLPKEFAEKWIEALRSGIYGQTYRKLTDMNDNYCCLGVACIIENIEPSEMANYNDTFFNDTTLKTADYFEGKNELIQILVEMNDYTKSSFKEIANWLEQNVEFI